MPTPISLIPPGAPATSSSDYQNFIFGLLDLEAFALKVQKLPATNSDFVTKYGTDFDDTEITGLVANFTSLQQVAEAFGNPSELGSITNESNSAPEPTKLLPKMIWLANQIKTNASKVSVAIGSKSEIYATLKSAQDKANVLQQLLLGGNGEPGIETLAIAISSKLSSIVTSLMIWHSSQLNPALEKITTYMNDKSNIMEAVNKKVSLDSTDLNYLQQEAISAYDEWKKYTGIAPASSIAVTVLSFGLLLPVGIGLAAGFGALATKNKYLYESYEAQIVTANEKYKQISALKLDLSAINSELSGYNTLVTNMHSALSQIQDTWRDFESTIHQLASLGIHELSAKSDSVDATHLEHAKKSWEAIGQSATDFLTSCIPPWDTSLSLGDPLPK